MAQKLIVEIIGDSRQLERTLTRTETKLQRFNRSAGGAASAFGVGGRGGALALGGFAAAAGLKSVVDAASNAQVILGQTSVAVKDAGLNWQQSSAQIEAAATRISKASSFDDEAVLQSFQVFVRGQKDVSRSLELSALAADVARGRYTDLASGTALVNKAAMGQVGALRRAGIMIDKNATSTEALTALTKAYGGAAEQYSDSAAGATDRLSVAFENLQESLGQGVLPLITQFAEGLSRATDNATKLIATLKAIKAPGARGGGGIFGVSIRDIAEGIDKRLGGSTFAPPGSGTRAPGSILGPRTGPFGIDFGATAKPQSKDLFKFGGAKPEPGAGAEQRNAWFDAVIGRELTDVQDISSLKGQIGRLREISGQITARIKVTTDITRKLTLEDQIKDIARRIKGTQADIAAGIARDAADADAANKANLAKGKEDARVAKQLADERARIAADGKRRKSERELGWLDFAIERATATKTISDDLRSQRAKEKWLKNKILKEGQTLALLTELWRTRDQIRELNKSKATTDPMAGLMQVSTSRLTSILAAGTGLGVTGRRQLGANIAGAELRLTVPVQIDGREVGRAVTKDQSRTRHRVANQTSGYRE